MTNVKVYVHQVNTEYSEPSGNPKTSVLTVLLESTQTKHDKISANRVKKASTRIKQVLPVVPSALKEKHTMKERRPLLTIA